MVYNNYVSLGVNCEAAFQIKRVLGINPSGFFSWNITRFPALLSLLDSNFEGILAKENLSKHDGGRMLHDSSHDFMFHSPFINDFLEDEQFDEKYEKLKGKFHHFKQKFLSLKDEGSTAFFYKTETDDNVRENSLRVRDKLYNFFPNKNFDLIILQHVKYKAEDWGEKNLKNRYLQRLAPWDDATDGHVGSWDRIFSEFPNEQKMKLAGY